MIIRAYVEAEQIPFEHNQIALYRWEPALTDLRSKYWYYNVPGGVGLFLKPALVTRMVRGGDSVPQTLDDICGNFPTLSLKELVKSHI